LTTSQATSQATIEALRPAAGPAAVWHTELAGYAGPVVLAGNRVIAALGGAGSVAGLALRGEPGAAVAALDAATGAPAWKLAVDSTEWSVIAALAAAGDGVVIGGAFSGTLRIADRVVSSAGQSDGFVARLTATGGVAWLIRVGGPGADAVHGVAAAADRIAIAGTFATGADLLGEPLVPFDERSPRADGFVAELDPAGTRRWVQSFGGKADDAVAGVAIDAAGRIAVAATVQDTVHIGGSELTASGSADGLVAWWGPGGTLLNAVLLGGADFDGLRAIAPAGQRIVVAGFYSGSIRLGAGALTAGGGDDAFIAALDLAGTVAQAWSVGGDGREEVTALAAVPGGFVAGVAHTAAAVLDGAALPAPADPMSGAAILIRPVR
jgi:outer membrane protein assembly factor BamB